MTNNFAIATRADYATRTFFLVMLDYNADTDEHIMIGDQEYIISIDKLRNMTEEEFMNEYKSFQEIYSEPKECYEMLSSYNKEYCELLNSYITL